MPAAGCFARSPFIQTPTLDIFLTHAHLDHIVRVDVFLWIFAKGNVSSANGAWQGGKIGCDRRASIFAAYLFPVKIPAEMRPLVQSCRIAGGGTLKHFSLVHPGGSLGFRLDWPGHSLAYVTDTSSPVANASYIEHIRGVDLLVHECYFPDGMEERAHRAPDTAVPAKSRRLRARLAQAAALSVHANPADGAMIRLDSRRFARFFPTRNWRATEWRRSSDGLFAGAA